MKKLFIAFRFPPQKPNYVQVINEEIREMLEKHSINLVSDRDLKDVNMRDKIEGLILYPFAMDMGHKYINQLPNLKVVLTVSTGYDHFKTLNIEKAGIRFARCVSLWPTAVADHGMSLLLASARRIVQGTRLTMSKDDLNVMDYVFTGPEARDVAGTTVGIVGMGDIGYEVAKRAHHGFGINILYHNRSQRLAEEELVKGTFYDDLYSMLPNCDFVVITCALNADTQNMFSEKAFRLMKRTAHLINISRGAIVDHEALVGALKSGELDGAALDVTHPEPLPRDHPLLQMPNVIITPHKGWNSTNAAYNMWKSITQNIVACLVENKTMPGEVFL